MSAASVTRRVSAPTSIAPRPRRVWLSKSGPDPVARVGVSGAIIARTWPRPARPSARPSSSSRRGRRAPTWRLTLAHALVVGGCGFVLRGGLLRQRVPRPLRHPTAVGSGSACSSSSARGPPGWRTPSGTSRGPLGSWGGSRACSPAMVRPSGFGSSCPSCAGWPCGRRRWWPASGTASARGALRRVEEHQLVNVVQEMAIAAGIPAPEVRLLDAEGGECRRRWDGRDRELRGRRPAPDESTARN